MHAIHAVYENGIFRPLDPVDLPDRCEVEIMIQSQPAVMARTTLARLGKSVVSSR